MGILAASGRGLPGSPGGQGRGGVAGTSGSSFCLALPQPHPHGGDAVLRRHLPHRLGASSRRLAGPGREKVSRGAGLNMEDVLCG